MLTFNRSYFAIAVLLFVTEVLIALFVHDQFVRPYVGDVLVVILIYTFVRSFVNIRVLPLAAMVLTFAFTIEFLQYINIVNILGLQNSTLASTVIGTSFAWMDLVAYVVGISIVVFVEQLRLKRTAIA